MSALSRRSFLLGSAAFGAAAFAGPSLAQFAPAPAAQRFSSVAVDVDRLHQIGLGPYAEFIRSTLLAETRRAFADRLGGPGPRLVVRITGIYLSSYSGGGGGRFSSAQHSDYLEGEALIVGRGGEVLGRYPQLSTTPAGSGGPWYDPVNSERRRAVYLAQHYASWLRRTIPG